MEKHPILEEVEAFLAQTGMSASYFGRLAVNNSELVKRLRNGQDITWRTSCRVREFMEKQGAAE